MLDFQDTTKQKRACSCYLCGESLTTPILYMGNFYGWSCIKKVDSTAKKPAKNSELWQPCDLISIDIINEYTRKIVVSYLGKNFSCFEYTTKLQSGKIRIDTSIVLNNGTWFINVLKFEKAIKLYYIN